MFINLLCLQMLFIIVKVKSEPKCYYEFSQQSQPKCTYSSSSHNYISATDAFSPYVQSSYENPASSIVYGTGYISQSQYYPVTESSILSQPQIKASYASNTPAQQSTVSSYPTCTSPTNVTSHSAKSYYTFPTSATSTPHVTAQSPAISPYVQFPYESPTPFTVYGTGVVSHTQYYPVTESSSLVSPPQTYISNPPAYQSTISSYPTCSQPSNTTTNHTLKAYYTFPNSGASQTLITNPTVTDKSSLTALTSSRARASCDHIQQAPQHQTAKASYVSSPQTTVTPSTSSSNFSNYPTKSAPYVSIPQPSTCYRTENPYTSMTSKYQSTTPLSPQTSNYLSKTVPHVSSPQSSTCQSPKVPCTSNVYSSNSQSTANSLKSSSQPLNYLTKVDPYISSPQTPTCQSSVNSYLSPKVNVAVTSPKSPSPCTSRIPVPSPSQTPTISKVVPKASQSLPTCTKIKSDYNSPKSTQTISNPLIKAKAYYQKSPTSIPKSPSKCLSELEQNVIVADPSTDYKPVSKSKFVDEDLGPPIPYPCPLCAACRGNICKKVSSMIPPPPAPSPILPGIINEIPSTFPFEKNCEKTSTISKAKSCNCFDGREGPLIYLPITDEAKLLDTLLRGLGY